MTLSPANPLNANSLNAKRSTFNVALLGPESSGKTTLARYLAKRYNGVFVHEYAREYMEALQRPYTIADVEAIARHQIAQLQELSERSLKPSALKLSALKREALYIFDTELIITKVWFEHKYGAAPDWLIDALHRYPMDVYLLCYPDLPWIPDPVRENPDIRLELFHRYEQEIQSLNIPYYIIRHE